MLKYNGSILKLPSKAIVNYEEPAYYTIPVSDFSNYAAYEIPMYVLLQASTNGLNADVYTGSNNITNMRAYYKNTNNYGQSYNSITSVEGRAIIGNSVFVSIADDVQSCIDRGWWGTPDIYNEVMYLVPTSSLQYSSAAGQSGYFYY